MHNPPHLAPERTETPSHQHLQRTAELYWQLRAVRVLCAEDPESRLAVQCVGLRDNDEVHTLNGQPRLQMIVVHNPQRPAAEQLHRHMITRCLRGVMTSLQRGGRNMCGNVTC